VSRIGDSIPPLSAVPAGPVKDVLTPMKRNVELLMGRTPGAPEVEPLASNATLAQVIAKVNELIEARKL